MATLIATGILTAYVYSVAATFLFAGDVFYEAAAMLTTFSLLGHWMEMAARNATGEAIASLLKLAPATARVMRDGQESEVAVEEVQVGDVIAVRPGEKVKALTLSRKVRTKIVQNLFWAAIYNIIAIPIAGGILYTSLGILLRPEWAALAMAASTITVTLNALALTRTGLPHAQSPGGA